ncbi:DnaD domain protein [Thermobacillus sp. ZCTH02-B1]|uniref:DnaD domain protein n=1 Tax=Thermobacillus sp. ZCTH02-B1 TaxID=1858795 RepID=UPI0025FDB585|nr:DnaD domain protein [Thermobacillus sp. ZCTH02-B1]
MELDGGMRIEHGHQFTEHHRYVVYRNFSLSPLDMKTLSLIYQPMIGAPAVSLYLLLYHQIDETRTGYSRPEAQRRLMLGLGVGLGDAGRRYLIEQASRLEAVGLLQTNRIAAPGSDEILYEYVLVRPLEPAEFFTNPHFTLLLRDKIGKYAVIALREQFESPLPEELDQPGLSREDLSVPFFEIFRVQPHSADAELEQALAEIAASRERAPAPPPEPSAGIAYGELILGFPRTSANRPFVERLRTDRNGMAAVNYIAYKYDLDAVDMRRLLDEPGVFSPDGELLFDELQRRASVYYRQNRRLEEERNRIAGRSAAQAASPDEGEDEPPEEIPVPEDWYLPVPESLAGRCDIAQYNFLMRNEPHTRFLKRFFPGAVPAWLDRAFERIDLHYRMPREVINVLIHYLFGTGSAQRLSGDFIDKVASNMLARGVDTYEKAIRYVREQMELEQRLKEAERRAPVSAQAPGRGSRGGRSGTRKPAIPVAEQRTGGRQLTPEELAEALRLASELERES